ncbi:MAG TPA: IPT/TIG domain-containing protein [Thermoanaerobaculia bacterium]|nr:IPT/TIG domain-containing protein [Thermoanaerobaculia bacterium]
MHWLPKSAVVSVLLACAFSAAAQNHPMPGAVPDPPVICTGCPGNNGAGEPNADKPTLPYETPIALHAGRYVDSSNTQTDSRGMITVRTGIVRVAPASRNRIYLQLGSMVGAFTLDTFFSTKLKEAMIPVNTIPTGSIYGGRNPFEKLAKPDRYFHAQSTGSGWDTPLHDSNSVVGDIDVDDRGYLYLATFDFGWGIISDQGDATGAQLPSVVHVPNTNVQERLLVSLRNGDSYYVFTSDMSSQSKLYDVTTPATPAHVATRTGNSKVFMRWSKYETSGRIALQTLQGEIRIYTVADLIADAAPLATVAPTSGKFFNGLSFDDDGNLWFTESTIASTTNLLWKLTPSESGYTTTTYDVYGSAFSPRVMHAGAGYIAVGGRTASPANATQATDLRLLKIAAGVPQLLDTGGFFQKYYYFAPSGYAQAGLFAQFLLDLRIVEQGGKTYLFYSSNGLGDVYELSEADRITSMTPLSGIPAGGTNVTIYGSGFVPGATVTFDGITASSTVVSPTQMTAVSPLHASGLVNVVVSVPGQDPMTAPKQFTYELTTPQQFVATATSTTSVAMSWSAVEGATQYEISRRAPDGTWSVAGSAFAPSFEDTERTPETTYVYRVRAADGAPNYSPYSAIDLATTTSHESSTITAGMPVLAADFTRLRTRVNALRAAANLSPYSFTGTLTGFVLAQDVYELRAALSQARVAHGYATPVFTDSLLTNVKIKAVHLDELLNLMK